MNQHESFNLYIANYSMKLLRLNGKKIHDFTKSLLLIVNYLEIVSKNLNY